MASVMLFFLEFSGPASEFPDALKALSARLLRAPEHAKP